MIVAQARTDKTCANHYALLVTNVSRKITDEIMKLERIIFKTRVPPLWEVIGRHEVGEFFLRKTFVKNWSLCYVNTDMTRVWPNS